MATYYDENGNVVEAFSKEELEAQLQEKIKANTPVVPDLSPVLERIQKTEKELYDLRVEKLADSYAGNDIEKRQSFINKFGRLTGYEDTADGLMERAKDAAKLAFDTSEAKVDTGGLADAGGKSINTVGDVKQSSPEDAELRKALGISDADIEKYGKNQ